MSNRTSPCKVHRRLAAALLLGIPLQLVAGTTDISTVPLPTYSVGSTVDIKPNILMVLDDSGSMSWNYLPDWANDVPRSYSSLPAFIFSNPSFNGVAYNPAITYSPPVTFNSSGAKDTTRYPSMTGTSAATGADTSKSLPNWGAVPADGYGVQTTAKTNLINNATFYTTVPGEFCDSPALTNCTTTSVPTGNYQYPAPLRWCNSAALTTCRANNDQSTWTSPRMPAPRIATITFSSASNAVITGITVDAAGIAQIMSGPTTSSSTTSNIAASVASAINACTNALTGNCTVTGYSAWVPSSGNVVTIYAPGVTTTTPALSKTGTLSATATAFAQSTIPLPQWKSSSTSTVSSTTIPGEVLFTTITSTNNSYPYPGTTAKAPTRTDCAGTTCTFNEEMTNYANWYAYYQTRMQMMKTSTSHAFAALDSDADIAAGNTRYRVGYMTINNNTSSDFVNVTDFNGAQKFTWFSKLFTARPNNSTPLRQALSTAGRYYAGKFNGSSVNGVNATDPLQYSCQRNYTILSTDGFWNGNAGTKLDGSTAVGNQDGLLPRPYNDGSTSQLQTRTSQLLQRTGTQQAQRGTLQQQISQLQMSTGQLQQRTSSNSGSTWTAWSNTNSCTADSSGKNQTQCRTVPISGPTGVSSCTPGITSSGIKTDCNTVVTTPYANASSCAVTNPDSNGFSTQCQYAFAAPANTQTCAPAYTPGDYTNVTVYSNCQASSGPTTQVSTCTATDYNASGQRTECVYSAWTAWQNTSSCSAVPQSPGPVTFTVGQARDCQATATGGTSDTLADVAQYYYATDLRSPTATGVDATGTCTGPIISPATTPSDLCADNVPAAGRDNNTKQHMTTSTLGLGAQGAMVFSNYQNTPAGQRVYQPDYWKQQSGDFYSVASGSTAAPSSGICPWMNSGATCVWPTPSSDSLNNVDDLWHAAVNGRGTYFSATDPQSLADSLKNALSQIVNTPRPGTAAAAASSNPNITSSDNFVFSSSYKSIDWYGELIMQRLGDDGSLGTQQWSAMQNLDCATSSWQANFAYSAGAAFKQGGSCYVVVNDHTSGATFDASSPNIALMTATPSSRTIYLPGGTTSSGLTTFTWSNLSSAQQNYFQGSALTYVDATHGLTQFCTIGASCMSPASQTAAAGSNLVAFLAGDRTYEGQYYRARKHVLGDIVSSEARYVKQPLLNYLDAGYSDYKTAMATRTATVYVGGNDGMLHAFNALTGQESWAFIPSAVLPTLYHLADTDYANKHWYYVDGTPEVADICPTAPTTACTSTTWKTILVGGLNDGGKSYYALDITDPAAPKLLWEFTDANMGLTYSNPRIVKLKDGTWVVMVASGYNNADGVGRLYVINANTGTLIRTISTGVGTAANPSGLSKLAARVPTSNTDNTVFQVYGGDLLGNVWRFDVNNDIGTPGYDAQLLINLQDPSGNPQPITAKPTVASVGGNPLVIVGTGRYLGVTDLSTTTINSVYGIQDKLTTTTLTTPRGTGNKFVHQVMTDTTCPTDAATAGLCTTGQTVRTSTNYTVDWTVNDGWHVDLVLAGERMVTDPTLGLGTLAFTTIKPQSSTTGTVTSCTTSDTSVSATSYLYYLNYLTGGPVDGSKGLVGNLLCTCVATRPSVVRLPDGTVEAIIRTSGSGNSTGTDMGSTSRQDLIVDGGGGALRRLSWRDLNGQ